MPTRVRGRSGDYFRHHVIQSGRMLLLRLRGGGYIVTGSSTKRQLIVLLTASALAGSFLLSAAPAGAVTWRPGANRSVSAYDYDDYFAVVSAGGFAIPSGYRQLSAVMKVTRNGKTIAPRVSSRSLAPGTYVTYNTVRYRPRSGGAIRTARVKRSVVVRAVNTDFVTAAEQRRVKCGMTQSRVESIIGGGGSELTGGDAAPGTVSIQYGDDVDYLIVSYYYDSVYYLRWSDTDFTFCN